MDLDQFTARRASLTQLVALLERQRAHAFDKVVAASALTCKGGALCVQEHDIDLTGVTLRDTAVLTPTPLAETAVGAKLGIPAPYLRAMRSTGKLDLWDHNVNAWLADEPERRFLVRGLVDDTGTGLLRALLSRNYRIIDNLDVLMTVLDGINASDSRARVVQADLTESQMFVKVRSDRVAAHAPALLRNYISPFTRERGADNPLVFAGFVFTDSETGHGKFKIIPQITVQICTNGMTMTRHALEAVHLGGELPDGSIDWSDDTRDAALELIRKRTRDAVSSFLSQDFLDARLAEIEADAGEPVSQPQPLIEDVSKNLRFSTEARDAILNRFIQGADMSTGGVLHAVTAAAQDLDDAEDAFTLEGQGIPAMRHAAELVRAGR